MNFRPVVEKSDNDDEDDVDDNNDNDDGDDDGNFSSLFSPNSAWSHLILDCFPKSCFIQVPLFLLLAINSAFSIHYSKPDDAYLQKHVVWLIKANFFSHRINERINE